MRAQADGEAHGCVCAVHGLPTAAGFEARAYGCLPINLSFLNVPCQLTVKCDLEQLWLTRTTLPPALVKHISPPRLQGLFGE